MLAPEKLELYENALKRAGLRLTDQRRQICAYLSETEQHPTPYEVYADLAAHHPEISRATVYNTLNTLQQLGVIVELSFGADHTHYDTDPTPHANLICLRCHRIVDYHGDLPLDTMRKRIVAETGFDARTARADLLGLCAECQLRDAAPPSLATTLSPAQSAQPAQGPSASSPSSIRPI